VQSHRSLAISVLACAATTLAAVGGWALPAGASATPNAIRITLRGAQAQRLTALYAAYRHIPVSDVAGAVPGSVQAAQLPRTGETWAVIRFLPSASAPRAAAIGFQDGGGAGVFARSPGGAWRMVGLGGEPLGCAARLPAAVRRLWRLSGCLPGSLPAFASPRRPQTSGAEELADIAEDQVGVSDNPAETNFNGLDCDPYTAMEVLGAASSGCGWNARFHLKNASELWCSDFAKWVWAEAGVTSDLNVLSPAADSFYTWGHDHGESLPVDGTNAKVGDAVVFYSAGTKPGLGAWADHVGLVTAVGPGTDISLVNGDFLGAHNISVQADNNISSLKSWAGSIWGAGEQWVFVSPLLSAAQRSPAVAADRHGNDYVFWKNRTDGGLEEAVYSAAAHAWSGPVEVKVDGRGMGPLGSAPTVAVGPGTAGKYADQYVFWEGVDRRLWEAWWDGAWHGPKDLGAGPLGSAPTAGVSAAGDQYVFWENTNRGLDEMWGNGSSWGRPHSIRVAGRGMGPLGSSPSIAVHRNGNRQVFWTGTDGNLWEAWWAGSWHGPVNLRGGPLRSPPSAAVSPAGRDYVFWSTRRQLREASGRGSSWSRARIGMGPLGSAPAATVSRAGLPQVFWKGAGAAANLWQTYQDHTNPSSWVGPTDEGFGPLG
jgi:CHAP domain